MKRKLSLLMAAIMALSTLPFTATEVHANTTNRIHGIPGTTVPGNTAFLEDQQTFNARTWSQSGGGQFSVRRSTEDGVLPNNAGGGAGVDYAITAGFLEIELRSRQQAGDMFRFELDNGDWLFRATTAATNELVTRWDLHDGTGDNTLNPTDGGGGLQASGPTGTGPAIAGTPPNPSANHGILLNIPTIRELILLNSEQRLSDRRTAGELAFGNGYHLTFDGPLGKTSINSGVTGLPTASQSNNGMPPIVRPSDWNFPHGYYDDWTGADASVKSYNMPSIVNNRLEQILSMPVSAMSTENPPSGLALDVHRIGSGLTVGTPLDSTIQQVVARTYDIRRGFYVRDFTGTLGAEGSYIRFANAVRDTLGGRSGTLRWTPADGVNDFDAAIANTTGSATNSPVNNRSVKTTPGFDVEVPYIMDISRVADGRTEATVTLLDNAEPTDRVIVPLLIRTPNSEGATIRLLPAGNRPFVTQGTWHIAAAGGVSTAAHVVSPVTSRDKFELDALVIRELRANSIRRAIGVGISNTGDVNAFDLVLTPGFYFDASVLTNLAIFLERDLRWRSGNPGFGNPTGTTPDFRVFFPEGHEASRDRLRIQLDGFLESQLIEGSVALYGLVIWAEETVPFDVELNIELQNTNVVAPGALWATNTQLGGLFPENTPAGWFVRAGITVGTGGSGNLVDFIRPRASSNLFDIIAVDEGVAADVTAAQSAGFIRRGALIGFTSQATVQTYSASGVPAGTGNITNLGNAASPTATPVTFRERSFTVTAPGVGLTQNLYNERAMITPQTIRAGTRRDWGVTLRTTNAVPELISGRYEGPTSVPSDAPNTHRTANVVFEETIPNSWWAGRQVVLSLPEGVKWRRVYFNETRNPAGSPIASDSTIAGSMMQRQDWYINIEVPPNPQTQQFVHPTRMHPVGGRATTARHGVHFDENKMFWTDILAFRGASGTGNWSTDNLQNRAAYIAFDSWVSVAADFIGDIILTAAGSAVPPEQNVPLPAAVIATAVPPVTVEISEITDVRVGIQFQPTRDIVIRETRAGALMRDKNVRVSVTDLVATDIMIGNNVNVEVTESNGFTIRNIGTGLAGSLYAGSAGSGLQPTLGIEANRGTVSFDVASISHSNPATITISGVNVRVDRTVPETNDVPYSVIVWGSAIANNFGNFDTRPVGQSEQNWPMHERTNLDRFMNNPGIFADYIRVVTGGDGSPWLTQEVRVTIGEMWYSVNGEQFEMDVAALLDPVTSSTFVPLRFIANAFGLRDDQIVWDDHNRTATIVLPGGRVVQFSADSSVMLDGGAPRNIVNAAGSAITPMIVTINEQDGGRMFLPFRFFGEAVLGVEVAWEADTQTAVFNPGGALTR